MNQQLSTLFGRKEIFDRKLEIINACIWLLIICLVVIPYFVIKNKDKVLNIYKYVGCFISAIQLVALITLLFTTPMLFDEKGSYVTAEGMFELAPTDNTIVFVLDSFDGGVLDDWFMDTLKISQIQNVVDAKGTFRFYHLGSFHIDFDINNAIKSLHIVDEYCKQLKDKGIYDNSTIIVTADHPVTHNGDYSILFLIKPQKAEGNMQISHAPVSQTEFIGTVLQSYNLSRSSDSVFDIPKNTERDRIKYETQLKNCSDIEGETELIEYILKGNSADSENYEPTGKKWKILFSENHVAID